jgi:cytoskeletal protein CcmA (bactofilin family)
MTDNSWNREQRPENPATGSSAGTAVERATIGPSVVIKGEVTGTEPLFIDGRVEGSITFLEHRVTVGRTSDIRADIRAHDVVVMGKVEGNIYCSDLLDIRADSSISGHMLAQRIRIDDGASLKGTVEVHPAKSHTASESAFPATETATARVAAVEETPDPAETFKETLLEAAAAVSVAGGGPARRVQGSRTLVEPSR